jgi:hypothetical protein
MVNFLEQLVAEWYEFNGYFVRRNVKVGPRALGGYECELDIVAFHPEKKHLVHIEPSTAADSWAEREAKFTKKFKAGSKYIPALFSGLDIPTQIDQIALLGLGSNRERATVGGGRLMMIRELMAQIQAVVISRPIQSAAVPEQYVILRSLQYAAHYWK